MNLFASASKKHPIAEPIKASEPSPFVERSRELRQRSKAFRWLHRGVGTYRKPKDEK